MTTGPRACTLRALVRAAVGLVLLAALNACDSPEEKEASYLERGIELAAAGEDSKALLEFRNVLRLNPKSAEAMYRIGLIHRRADRIPEALGAFKSAVAERPDFVAAQVQLGTMALVRGDLETASTAAEAVHKLEPQNPEGLALRAALALRAHDTEGALQLANSALERAPHQETAVAVLAGAYQELGETERALTLVEDAVAASPTSTSLRLLKIALLNQSGETAGIAETYRELFALEPEAAEYRRALATVYLQQKDPAAAEEVLRAALEGGLLDDDTVGLFLAVVRQRGGADAAEAELRALIDRHPARPELRFRLAELYAGADKTAQAEKVLDAIMAGASAPDIANAARVGLAQLRLAAGDREGAAKFIDAALASSPEHRDANLVRGFMLLDAGRIDDAVRSIRTALRQAPRFAPGLRLLAEAHLRKGGTDLAIDALGEAVDADPTNREYAELLGSLLTRRGDYDAALKLWDHVLRLDRTSSRALQARAEIEIQKRNWSAAQANIDWLLEQPGHQTLGALLRGRLLAAQGRFADSRAAFAEAQRLAPDAAAPTVGLVDAYLAENDLDGAVAYLERRTTERPNDAAAFSLLGEIRASQGAIDQAQDAFERVISLRPDAVAPRRQLGRTLIGAGRLDQAIGLYQEARDKLPDSVEILGDLARAYYLAGAYDQALETYDRILDLQPHTDVAANNYAAIVADHRPDDVAARQRALERIAHFRGSANPLYLDTLGWLHYRNGEFAVAVPYLERAVSLAADQPQLRYHLGMALLRTGEQERALDHLRAAVAANAAYPGADDARKILEQFRNSAPPQTLPPSERTSG